MAIIIPEHCVKITLMAGPNARSVILTDGMDTIMANADLSLSLYLPSFRTPAAEMSDIAYIDETGIHLFSGGDATTALKSTPIKQIDIQTDINGIQNVVPQTLTLSYVNLHLVTGETVNINSNYATIDNSYNDYSFAYLKDVSGSSQTALLQDSRYFSKKFGTLKSDFEKIYTLFQGAHTGQHLIVDHTGDYTLVLGVADVGDKTGTSGLVVTDVSLGLTGSMYTVAAAGVVLSDGTLEAVNGLQISNGKAIATNNVASVLNPGAQSLILGLSANFINQGIADSVLGIGGTGGGVLGRNAGGDINPLAGGLPSLTTRTTYPGAGLVAINASALISQDGSGIIAAGGGNIIASGGGNIVASGGGNLVPLVGGNLISQDGGGIIAAGGGNIVASGGGNIVASGGGNIVASGGGNIVASGGGNIIAAGGGNLAATKGTASFVLNGTGVSGATAAGLDGTGTATGIAFATTPVTRSYTLTADPEVAPVLPPTALGEIRVSPQGDTSTIYQTPAITNLSDGRTVVVWTDNLLSKDSSGTVVHSGTFEIRGQITNSDGSASGGPFDISVLGGAFNPSVAGLADGRFVVSYTAPAPNPFSTDVVAQFFNADATPNGTSITVNAVSTGQVGQSAVGSLSGGGAVVVYRSPYGGGGNGYALFGHLYAADGTPQGDNFAVGSADPAQVKSDAVVAGLQDGGFVVAYSQDQNGANASFSINVQRFTAPGASAGAPIVVKQNALELLYGPAVAVLTDETFVVTYVETQDNVGGPSLIRAQHFSSAGATIGTEVTISSDEGGQIPVVSALADGTYAVIWGLAQSGLDQANNLQGQVLSADGVKQGAIFAVNPVGFTNPFGSPVVATLSSGALEVVGALNGGQVSSDIRSETLTFPTTAVTPTTYGRVVDGIVKGATVFADANGNGKYDMGEAIATTDATGRYAFTTPAKGAIIVTGGTDLGTGLPFKQTFMAPAGSLSVTALSTLVQKMVTANGITAAEATLRVNAALGLPLNTNLTALNPLTATLNGAATAKALIADAVVTDTVALAQAGGATGDLYGKLAAVVFGSQLGTTDPTSVTTIQALGLDLVTSTGIAALAKNGAALLAQKLTTEAGVRGLVNDLEAVQSIQQGVESSDLKTATATGSTGYLLTKYSADNLTALAADRATVLAGTVNEFAYTDVTTTTLGYAHGDTYAGPVAGLVKQFIWNSSDKVAIAARTNNVFLHGGSGDDALSAFGGVNVLDGGAGSNFLTGAAAASSVDQFYVDGRDSAVTWSTIVNFHAGDSATIFGFHAGISTQPISDTEGAAGYKGATIHSELAGAGTGVNASMTFAGIDSATAAAHFSINADTLSKGTANAIDYLLIQYNR